MVASQFRTPDVQEARRLVIPRDAEEASEITA